MQSLLLLILLPVLSSSAQQVYYVKPKEALPEGCPGHPCLTLEQYSQHSKTYFTTHTSVLFLAGNHSLQTTMNMSDITAVSLRRKEKDSEVIIRIEGTFLFEKIVNLTIEGLIFELHSSNEHGSFSALKMINSTGILISRSMFRGSKSLIEDRKRAVYSELSSIVISSSIFEGSTGSYGGAIYANRSNIVLAGNVFKNNVAMEYGGAVYAYKSFISLKGNSTSVYEPDGVMNSSDYASMDNAMLYEISVEPGVALFLGNEAGEGGAISMTDSNASFSGTVIVFKDNVAHRSGAIYMNHTSQSSVHVITSTERLYFIGNRAHFTGGAIFISSASLIFSVSLMLGETMDNHHYFLNNSQESIFCSGGGLTIAGTSYFMNNGYSNSTAHDSPGGTSGGAIRVDSGSLTVTGTVVFSRNKATYGGAIALYLSAALFSGTLIEFIYNEAYVGGAIQCLQSSLVINSQRQNFIGNTAETRGGAIAIINHDLSQPVVIAGNYAHNMGGECGGALHVEGEKNVTFVGITATGNSDSAVCVSNGKVIFTGTTTIANNTGAYGGGINAKNSVVLFTVNTLDIGHNQAFTDGGAIYSLYGTIDFQSGTASLTHNTAESDGGALCAVGTHIILNHPVLFTHNSAQNGGAMYFKTGARLTLETDVLAMVMTSYNYASGYGGAIFHEDVATRIQCDTQLRSNTGWILDDDDADDIPYCFIELKGENIEFQTSFTSYFDSAGRDGGFLYGGLLDRCRMDVYDSRNYYDGVNSILPYYYIQLETSDIDLPADFEGREITSQPYMLCFCESSIEYFCNGKATIDIYRGQKWKVSLIAFDQVATAVSTAVTAITSLNARLELNQSPQILPHDCSNLTYSLYSTEMHEDLILYPNGPCHDLGLARAVISVTFLPCPHAFIQSGERCVCEERLQVHDIECKIDEVVYFFKKAGSKFWMSAKLDNGTYQGLIVYDVCPLEYCKAGNVDILLDNPDVQCDHNRSGLLCGQCSAHHSLMLGTSQCRLCSNTYLALLLPFAAAGIALVIFLSFLRLTVATGMLNSIILYTNIVQANRNLFFNTNSTNVLTVFLAWVNLDLGFQTCFFHGMDAYAQTWLQFAFPVYVWILISLIILTSRYSITISKLIGSNPAAVLATLLLMSYAKILKVIIEVYSSVDLEYPNDKKITMWLKDANVPYLQSKHLFLTVVTSLVLVFLFLPYTLLLLFGHKLYRFTGRKCFHWLNKIKPILDSYYAPYKIHTRYWTGFLLLVRCALYIVFSLNSLGATNKSLLAINITFTALIVIAWLSVVIYKNFYVNVIEASVYLNLIILSAASSNGVNSPVLVYSLVGLVFTTMVGIIVYHFHLVYTSKSPMWLGIRARGVHFVKKMKSLAHKKTILPPINGTSSHDPYKIVSKTVIDLREPLLEN